MRRFPEFIVIFGLIACQSRPHEPGTRSASTAGSAHLAAPERAALAAAEQRRDSSAVGAEVLSSRDVSLRRRAARALSRIADARAAELLSLALSDEDPEVITWAAYGLGYTCQGREPKTVHALVARAASLPPANASAGSALSSPSEAISDALGRCAGNEAESTLRAWLRGPKARAEAAALALGRIAGQTGKLDDSTLVTLLDAADRNVEPLENALFPLTRLATLNASTGERARSLTLRLVQQHAPGAEFGLRALSRTGEPGAAALGTLLADTQLAAALRAQAARELVTLGASGQRPLWAAFDSWLSQPPSNADLQGAGYGPLSTLLDGLQPPILSSGSKLQALAGLALNDTDSASLTRRKVQLRCAAAALLAASNFQNVRLLGCDPAKQSLQRDLAVLRVLGREKLQGSRKKAFLQAARATDARLREAALELLPEHAELGDSYALLAEALSASALGVVASAAHVLSRYPERATKSPGTEVDLHNAPNPDTLVIQGLTQAYATARSRNSVEVQSALLDAIGALQILSFKEQANAACSSDNPTLREHAQKALRLLGEQSKKCDQFKPSPATPLAEMPAKGAQLTLETDAGTLTLTLDATLAPSAVARVVALAQAGFYDGMAVHRVVPGFVAQFGDPQGDGYGGDDKPPLRCETSPLPFRTGSLGVALSGRDTGSSQLFVTLGRYPHLDGQYAWLGEAGPGWELLAQGDRIVRARVSPAP